MINPKIRFKRDDGSEYPEWNTYRFGETVTIERGGSPRPIDKYITNSPNGLNWIKIGDAPVVGRIISSTAQKIIPEGLKKTRKVFPGDLILSNSMSFGKPYIMGVEGCIHDGWLLIRNDNKNYDLAFLCELLSSESMLSQYKRAAAGSTVSNLNKELVGNALVTVPCLEEQQKIADFLSSVDDIISASEAEVKNLEEQKKGVMQKIFSQEVRFKADDGSEYPEWKEKTFHETGEFFGGLSGKCKDDFEHGDDVFITYMNVFSNIFADESMVTAVNIAPGEKQRKIQFGDIMFTQSSETVEEVGMSSVWIHDSNPYMNSFCMCLRPYSLNDISPWYMGYALRSELVRKQIIREGQGISRINLASSRIQNVTYPLPCLEEQQKIADFLSSFDEAIEQAKNELDKWKELKKGLLQQMFV